MRLCLMFALTLALLLASCAQLSQAKLSGIDNVAHHRSTTIASLRGNLEAAERGTPPPGSSPRGPPPSRPAVAASA